MGKIGRAKGIQHRECVCAENFRYFFFGCIFRCEVCKGKTLLSSSK